MRHRTIEIPLALALELCECQWEIRNDFPCPNDLCECAGCRMDRRLDRILDARESPVAAEEDSSLEDTAVGTPSARVRAGEGQ
jgi:hypothetical protein